MKRTSSLSFPIQLHKQRFKVSCITYRETDTLKSGFAFKICLSCVERVESMVAVEEVLEQERPLQDDASSVPTSPPRGENYSARATTSRKLDTKRARAATPTQEPQEIQGNRVHLHHFREPPEGLTMQKSKSPSPPPPEPEPPTEYKKISHRLHKFTIFLNEERFHNEGYKFAMNLRLKRLFVWLRDALLQKTSKRQVKMKLYVNPQQDPEDFSSSLPLFDVVDMESETTNPIESPRHSSLPSLDGSPAKRLGTPLQNLHLKNVSKQHLNKHLPSSPTLKHYKTTYIPNHQLDSHTLTFFFCPHAHTAYISPSSTRVDPRVDTSLYCSNDEDDLVLRLIHSKHSSFSKAKSCWFVLNHSVKIVKEEIIVPPPPKRTESPKESPPASPLTEDPPFTPPVSRGEPNTFPKIIYITQDEDDETEAHQGEDDFPLMSVFDADQDLYFSEANKHSFAKSLSDKLDALKDISPGEDASKNENSSALSSTHIDRNFLNASRGFRINRQRMHVSSQKDPSSSADNFAVLQQGTYKEHTAFQKTLSSQPGIRWTLPDSNTIELVNLNNQQSNPSSLLYQLNHTHSTDTREKYSTAICDWHIQSGFIFSWCVKIQKLPRRNGEIFIGVCRGAEPAGSRHIHPNYCIALDADELNFAVSNRRFFHNGAPRGDLGCTLSEGDDLEFTANGVEGKLYYSINGKRKRVAMRVTEKQFGEMRPAVSFGRGRYSVAVG